MNKQRKVAWATLLLIASFAAAVAYHYWRSAYEGETYPHSTYLFKADDSYLPTYVAEPLLQAPYISAHHIFGDFLCVWYQNRLGTPYHSPPLGPSNYFPFAHLLTMPFAFFPKNVALPLLLGAMALILIAFEAKYLWDRSAGLPNNVLNVLVMALLTYPAQMMLDRGNLEGLMFGFIALFAYFFQEERFVEASLCAGCAAAMKGYPGLLLFIVLGARQYKAFAIGMISIGLATLAGLAGLHGSIKDNALAVIAGAKNYQTVSEAFFFLWNNHSLHGLERILITYVAPSGVAAGVLQFMMEHHLAIGGTLLAIATLALVIRPAALWMKMALAFCAIGLLFRISPDYRLIALLVPFTLFFDDDSLSRRWNITFLALFVGLLIPKGYGVFVYDVQLSSIVSPILVTILYVVLLVRMFGSTVSVAPAR